MRVNIIDTIGIYAIVCYKYPERHVVAQVILAFSVFMLAIAERMPETSESIPLIGENWISI